MEIIKRYHSLFISLGVLSLLLMMGVPCITAAAPLAPVANFTANLTSGAVPLPVSFTDASSDNPTGWAWFFGDENFTEPWTLVNAGAGWSERQGHTSVAMPDGSIVLMGGGNGGSGTRNDVWRSTDNGTTWTQMNASAGWSGRWFHSSVAMPDGSIVLTGGSGNNGIWYKDVWRSTDYGATWTRMNASAGWSERSGHTSVAMQDGSIVLMGGSVNNDVWRSTDNGATWTQVNSGAGWVARYHQTSVVMPDGSIVLMGGFDSGLKSRNDVWRSTDYGATWIQVNASAGWSVRNSHTSVAMPDGSIILMGGAAIDGYKNDLWRSTDNGTSWTQVSASARWTARSGHTSVVMPDSSIVLMGGGLRNDVWRFLPVGSSAQNPSHIYTTPGTYQVALQVYNADGYSSTRKTAYITVAS